MEAPVIPGCVVALASPAPRRGRDGRERITSANASRRRIDFCPGTAPWML